MKPIGDLGPRMSAAGDPTYASSQAYIAGASGMSPDCECPGFDPQIVPSMAALVGRWVRSPKKFVGWDTYMEFFGLKGMYALQETEEPQEHVILHISKEQLRILHRLPWRDGLDCEYTVPIDGSTQPVPPAMVARASSSWKVNDLATWSHAWDDGVGNPLHRGLRTEQRLTIKGVNYALRYWRSLIAPHEMRVNVEVTYADTGKYAVHTQRFFHKIDVVSSYAIVSLPSVPATFNDMVTWTHNGRLMRMVILPQASNMPRGWTSKSKEQRWKTAEPFPSAGRSSGPYLSKIRAAARDANVWVCCGVVLRNLVKGKQQGLLQGMALIGADGWLHAVYTSISPTDTALYVAGAGNWPATQRLRHYGVYDTELGRIALSMTKPSTKDLAQLAAMGAEVVLVPPITQSQASRVVVNFSCSSYPAAHANTTRYLLCGPEELATSASDGRLWQPIVVSSKAAGALQATTEPVPIPRDLNLANVYSDPTAVATARKPCVLPVLCLTAGIAIGWCVALRGRKR